MSEAEQQVLKEIIDQKPYLYLDVIQEELYQRTGGAKFYHGSTIWCTLKKKLRYSLQVVTERARQQDENEHNAYLEALEDIVFDTKILLTDINIGQRDVRHLCILHSLLAIISKSNTHSFLHVT